MSSSRPASTGVDKILKFQAGETLEFKRSKFDGLTKGELSPDQFVVGKARSMPMTGSSTIRPPAISIMISDGVGGVAKTLVVACSRSSTIFSTRTASS